MPLPDIPVPWFTETVCGVEVSFRSLTVGQYKELQALQEEDPEATGPQSIAWAFDVTVEEADKWVKAVSPAVALEVGTLIMRRSGLDAIEAARFPADVHARGGRDGGLPPGRPAEEAAGADPGHAGP
jgi:hypothetical protein